MRSPVLARPVLAVGDRVADAWQTATGSPATRRADVHAALLSLATEGSWPVLIGDESLVPRPRAALRALRRAARPEPVVVLSDRLGTDPRVARAARAQGVPRADTVGEVLALLGRPAPAREAAPPSPPPRRPARDPEMAFVDGCVRRLGSVDDLAGYVLKSVAEAAGARRASLLLLDRARARLELTEVLGADRALIGQRKVPLGAGMTGRAAAHGRVIVGRGAVGGGRDGPASSYVCLPLGPPSDCEGVAALTDLPGDLLPSDGTIRLLRRMALRAGRSLSAARRLRRAESLSTTDALTELPNRRGYEQALRRELERARRSGCLLGLGVFDIDHFKTVNDAYGHPAGDRVLVEVARRLSRAFRETDLTCRWGGEEFVVLLPGLDAGSAAEALAIMERGRRAVGARPVALGPGMGERTVHVSGGVALFPTHATDGEGLLREADRALRKAKDDGRDRVEGA